MTETPSMQSIGDLLKQVDNGKYVIPYFQRGFEWQPSMVCDLIESIAQGYYTVLIMGWNLNRETIAKEKLSLNNHLNRKQ